MVNFKLVLRVRMLEIGALCATGICYALSGALSIVTMLFIDVVR